MKTIADLMCRMGFHDWLVLSPRRSEEAHRLCINCGRAEKRSSACCRWMLEDS